MKPTGALDRLIRWADARLHRKFNLLLIASLLGTSLLFLALVITLYRNQLVTEHTRASMQVNRLLEASLKNAMLKRDLEGLRQIVTDLGNQQEIVAAMILNRESEVRFSSKPDRLGTRLQHTEIGRALRDKTPQAQFIALESGKELLRSINPVANQDICIECHGTPETNPVNGLLIVDYDASGIKGDARP